MLQGHDQPPTTTPARRCRGDQGAAAVEFAFMVPLLALFIFGIIHFGLLLSFTQDMTRAAAEGARAGAVAFDPADAENRALAATEDGVNTFDRSCLDPADGLTCEIDVDTCAVAVGGPAQQCITVSLSYDYAGHPLLARIPIVSGFLPDRIERTSVARINE